MIEIEITKIFQQPKTLQPDYAKPYQLVCYMILWQYFIALQVSAEDLYWEGEEDASNEFLEVKVENLGIGSHLRRLKRGLFDFWQCKYLYIYFIIWFILIWSI